MTAAKAEPNDTPEAVTGRLEEVRAAIAAAAQAAGRPPEEVKLVAVTKTFGAERIVPAITAGQRVFGENRVQEAQRKWPALREAHEGIELHLVGPLQSNKAKDAVALFDVIQTVDRDKIAAALAKEIAKQGRRPRLLVEINTGAEPQKAGVLPVEAAAFVARCREVHGLSIEGLMCIPPIGDDPEPHFRLLARLADELGLPERSMGMSADYALAIRCGATMVRVGTAIFGERARG